MSRPYTHREGPYQDPTLYDDDSNGAASNGASQAYQYDNPSGRNEYGRAASAYDQAAASAPYPFSAQSYPGAPTHNQRSRDGSAEASVMRGGYTRGRYMDRDAEGYHSDHDEKGLGPYSGVNPANPPSRTLILEGLPFEMTQEDIVNELKTNLYAKNLEEVRLIKDKRTGLSRQFAFAQFATLADAQVFYDQTSPTIQFKNIYSEIKEGEASNAHVTIAYSREKPEERPLPGQGDDDWICEVCQLVNYGTRTICFKCHAPLTENCIMPNKSKNWPTGNKGDQDVAGMADHPSQYLLLRKLDAGVTEELLARGVMKLCRDAKTSSAVPTAEGLPNKRPKIASTSKEHFGAKEGSLRRVLLARSRKDGKTMNFGFAEFATVQDAVDAHKKARSSEGFTIKSKPVDVDFIHSGVFKTVAQLTYPVEEKYTFSALNNPDLKIIYRDEKAYCGQLVLEKEKTDMEKKKAKIDELTKRARAAADDRGLLGPPTGKTIAGAKKRKEKEDAKASEPKSVQFSVGRWEKSKAELHGSPPPAPTDESAVAATLVHSPAVALASSGDTAQRQQSFRWMHKQGTPQEQIQCILCRRVFETKEKIIQHELGTMHKTNIQNADLVEKTLQKYPALKNATVSRKTNQAPEQDSDAGDTYVDRAALRRQQFAQPRQPQQGQKRKSPEPEQDQYFKPAENKAAKMLEKMGWSAGQGLGAEGTGRTEAIATELYAQGVGLGAVGGKVGDAVEEANKATGSTYKDFLEQGKDKARRRFEEAQ